MSDRPHLRPAVAADGARLARIYAPFVEQTAISFESRPPTVDEMGRRIGAPKGRWPWLVAELDDVVAGYAYGSPHRARPAYRWSAEVSVYVAAEARRRGLGRRLYTALLRILELQGFATAFAGITLPNPASVRLHESLGFEPLGVFRDVGYKLGRWHDVGWWSRPLARPQDPPVEPRSFAEVRQSPELRELLEVEADVEPEIKPASGATGLELGLK